MPVGTAVVSAPGKMLLAGGYLVLDESNVGLVVAVDKRFYAECRVEYFREDADLPAQTAAVAATEVTEVTVISPQFNCEWMYYWTNHQLISSKIATQNLFVEKALRVAFLYLDLSSKTTVKSISIRIAADNDFYSLVPHLQARGWPQTLKAAQDLPYRLLVAKDPATGQVYKTGLGSSACLVTAITGAIVRALSEPFNIKNHEDFDAVSIDTVTKLAQIGHCYAQAKVGSGFDVSAASYGSHIYQRFPTAVLNELLVLLDGENANAALLKLKETVDHTSWSGGVKAPVNCFFTTASFLQVMMADVSGGSESPSMANQVLTWRKSQQEQFSTVPHWDDLVQINLKIVSLFQQIHVATTHVDNSVQHQFIGNTDWSTLGTPLASLMQALKSTILEARHHLKAMGEKAGVPIEPDAQSALCDACMKVPGVVAALVPGAGGYDAVSCIYINVPSVRQAVADLWTNWTHDGASVCALTVSGVDYGDGVRVETEFPSVASNNF